MQASTRVVWIAYITGYREGGPRVRQAALTLEGERRRARPECLVLCEAVETKRAFVDALARIRSRGQQIRELHLIGHSAVYGFMFGTCQLPEQFSPYEWRQLSIPFARDGEAFFHGCRSARWFAPFFARTFGVPASGFHWYTTFSTRRRVFRWPSPLHSPRKALYLVGCPGRKSHGLLGSLAKYSGFMPTEALKRVVPTPIAGDPPFDSVAAAYDRAHADIRIRADEWAWLNRHLPETRPRVLDIGCGNGALLVQLAGAIRCGVGVDISRPLVEIARRRARELPHLRFEQIDGPALPLDDESVDVVVSLLSFRYLDWDPIMNELRRVLAPGGRILIVDIVTTPMRASEIVTALRSAVRRGLQRRRLPAAQKALRALERDPRWSFMAKYSPIRMERELRLYLESRYPGCQMEVLSLAWNHRTLAFDSGPLRPGWVAPQSYP